MRNALERLRLAPRLVLGDGNLRTPRDLRKRAIIAAIALARSQPQRSRKGPPRLLHVRADRAIRVRLPAAQGYRPRAPRGARAARPVPAPTHAFHGLPRVDEASAARSVPLHRARSSDVVDRASAARPPLHPRGFADTPATHRGAADRTAALVLVDAAVAEIGRLRSRRPTRPCARAPPAEVEARGAEAVQRITDGPSPASPSTSPPSPCRAALLAVSRAEAGALETMSADHRLDDRGSRGGRGGGRGGGGGI